MQPAASVDGGSQSGQRDNVALVGASSSSEVLLSTEQNFRAMETLVAGIRQTLVNNVLRRTATPTDIALARCDVADELLVIITLLAAYKYACVVTVIILQIDFTKHDGRATQH